MSLARIARSVAVARDRCGASSHDFRRRVWTIKMAEAACAAAFGVVVAYLLMFALDRVWDTPAWLRGALFVAALRRLRDRARWRCYRWVWRQPPARAARPAARPEAPAGRRPAARRHRAGRATTPSRPGRARSARRPSAQVAEDARKRDFRDAVPNPRHRLWAWPGRRARGRRASACSRSSRPRRRTPGRGSSPPGATRPATPSPPLEPLPDTLVVAHGEPFTVAATARRRHRLAARAGATARLGDQHAGRRAARATAATSSSCPPQIDPGWLDVRIGDSTAARPRSSRRCGPS